MISKHLPVDTPFSFSFFWEAYFTYATCFYIAIFHFISWKYSKKKEKENNFCYICKFTTNTITNPELLYILYSILWTFKRQINIS